MRPRDARIADVAFVGLGQLGGALRGRAAPAGYRTVGVDPARTDAMAAVGPVVAGLEEVPDRMDCLCLCLPGPLEYLDALAWVVACDPARRPRYVVNLTTVGPHASAAGTRLLSEHCPDVWHAECPVMGGVVRARSGRCTLLYGSLSGPPSPPLNAFLHVLGAELIVCADVAEAAVAKLVNNLVAVSIGLCTMEAIDYGTRAGLSTELLLTVLRRGTASSYILENTVRRAILEEDLDTGFATRLALKDMLLASGSGKAHGSRMVYADLAVELLMDGMRAGLGQRSFATAATTPRAVARRRRSRRGIDEATGVRA